MTTPARPPAQRKPWGTILGIVLLVALFLFILVRHFWREDPLEQFRRDVLATLPIGTPQADVVAWAQRQGVNSPLRSWNLDDPGLLPGRTFPEAAGMPREDLVSFVEVGIPWGTYTVRNEVGDNRLWTFVTFDKEGRVKGHYFLTLEQLAAIEQARAGPEVR
jgi:hypothetical protein